MYNTPPTLYHEKQRLQFCLIHTLNNILQKEEFTPEKMNEICYSFDKRRWFNPHKSWFGFGNYDVNILMAALQQHALKIVWFDKRLPADRINLDVVKALVFNVKSKSMFSYVRGRHWFSVIPFDGEFYNLDSKIESPQRIHYIEDFIRRYHISPDSEIMVVVGDTTEDSTVIQKE